MSEWLYCRRHDVIFKQGKECYRCKAEKRRNAIAKLLCYGWHNKEIAKDLNMRLRTVKKYTRDLCIIHGIKYCGPYATRVKLAVKLYQLPQFK